MRSLRVGDKEARPYRATPGLKDCHELGVAGPREAEVNTGVWVKDRSLGVHGHTAK